MHVHIFIDIWAIAIGALVNVGVLPHHKRPHRSIVTTSVLAIVPGRGSTGVGPGSAVEVLIKNIVKICCGLWLVNTQILVG